MQTEYKSREKIVGIFIISVLALLLSTVVMTGRGQNWFKKSVTYYTTFNESYNLQANAAVKLFKADIGKVRKINLVENRVRVELSIFEEYAPRITVDTVASVASPTFIGDEYVSIKPGEPAAPLIPEGGQIDSVEKRSISDFMDQLEVEKTSKMIIAALQGIAEIVQVLRDPEGPLLSALNNLNRIVSDIESGKGTIGNVLKSREMLESIVVKLDKVGKILDNINHASAQVPETIAIVNDNLKTIKQAGDGIVDRVAYIREVIAGIEDGVGKLNVILSNMETGSHEIPQITRTTKISIQEIRDGVKKIDQVVQSIRQNVLIRSNLPEEPAGKNMDAGLRQ